MTFHRERYPENWLTEIRPRILERAGHKCELCGIDNKALGARDKAGKWHSERSINNMNSDYGMSLFGEEFPKIIQVVLTVAHIDNPDPMDCRDENLKALCQLCHNRLDAPMRAKNAKRTRAAKKKQAVADSGQLQLPINE